MALTTEEEVIVKKRIEINALEAKLDKKRADNRGYETLDEEVLYSKRLALAALLKAQK